MILACWGLGKSTPLIFTVWIADRKEFRAGTIFLRESTVNLGEVTVTAQKSLVNTSIDRKVATLQQDIMSKSGSVSDLLQNVPSVQVDVDGNVSLRGSQTYRFLINGKPSPLLGNNVADALQQLPASSVEKIEVITNPSAKFTPEGTAGIINIVLKKDANLGFNGSMSANAGNNSRYSFSTNDNYNFDGINIFGNYSIRQDERTVFSTLAREQLDSTNIPNYFNESGRAVSRPSVTICGAWIRIAVLAKWITRDCREIIGTEITRATILPPKLIWTAPNRSSMIMTAAASITTRQGHPVLPDFLSMTSKEKTIRSASNSTGTKCSTRKTIILRHVPGSRRSARI